MCNIILKRQVISFISTSFVYFCYLYSVSRRNEWIFWKYQLIASNTLYLLLKKKKKINLICLTFSNQLYQTQIKNIEILTSKNYEIMKDCGNLGLIIITPKFIHLKNVSSMAIAISWFKVLVTFLRVKDWVIFTNQCNTKVCSNINIKIELCWKNSLVFEIKQAKYAKCYLERQIFHHYWKANNKMQPSGFSYENVAIS